jgi:hypothetical protein
MTAFAPTFALCFVGWPFDDINYVQLSADFGREIASSSVAMTASLDMLG